MIEIDGSKLEGGGQILRTATALSAITQKPCYVFNIRKNRAKPGLMVQHLASLKALGELCEAKIEGAGLGSQEIRFQPRNIQAKNLKIKMETAGSITLALQTLILPCLKAPSPIVINFQGGATDTFFSPTLDYFRYVFIGLLEKIFKQKIAQVQIKKRGFYPEGGSEVEIKLFPLAKNLNTYSYGDSNNSTLVLKNLNLAERGVLKRIIITSIASKSLERKKVAGRQGASAMEFLKKLKLPVQEKIEYCQSSSPGSAINIIGEFENTILGADNLGKLGKSAEEVGKIAGEEFFALGKSNVCLDKYMADQILPFMAVFGKKSKVSVAEITKHCQTNIWVIEKFLEGKFETKNNLISWSF